MSEKTKVVFRRYRTKEGEVVALFPDLPWDHRGHCTCYAHLGQHGGADYGRVIRDTRPATEAEYAPLKRELESIGYVLEVRRRRTW